MQNDFYPDNANIGDLGNKGFRKPGIKQASILYSITVVLFLVVGSRVQRNEFYSGILITEFLLILAPALALLFIYRYDIKRVLRLNRIRFLNIFLIFCIMIFAIPVVGVFNLANLWLIRHIFGKVMVVQPPAATNLAGLLMNILVIGGAAGICEEVMFRGVIQRSFERLGVTRAILIAAFLFGLIHTDFQKLLGTFLLGALIGFIVYRTNSIFGGMFAHFTNNSAAVIMAYLSNKFIEMARTSGMGEINGQYDVDRFFSTFADMPRAQLLATIIGWAFIFLFCVSVLTGLMVAFLRTTSGKAENVNANAGTAELSGMLWLLPGLLMIVFIYVYEGLKLMGVSNEVVDSIIRLLR